QIMSWIHINDLAAMFLFALQNEKLNGTYNAVAPHPVSNKTIMKAIAKIKGGFSLAIPVPAFALKITMGEMATEILKSTTVSAAKILEAGFTFQYTDVDAALHHLIKT